MPPDRQPAEPGEGRRKRTRLTKYGACPRCGISVLDYERMRRGRDAALVFAEANERALNAVAEVLKRDDMLSGEAAIERLLDAIQANLVTLSLDERERSLKRVEAAVRRAEVR